MYFAFKYGNGSLKTDVVIETAGQLSFKSSLVGATVLIVSLAFFYLYLKHVFQIQHPVPPHISLVETDAPVLHTPTQTNHNDKSKKGK